MASLTDDVGDAGDLPRLARHFGVVIEYILKKQNIPTESLSLWSLSDEGRQALLSSKEPVNFQSIVTDSLSFRHARSATSPPKTSSRLLHGRRRNKKRGMHQADAVSEVQVFMTPPEKATLSPNSSGLPIKKSGSTTTEGTTQDLVSLHLFTPCKLYQVEEDALSDSAPVVSCQHQQINGTTLPHLASPYVGEGSLVLYNAHSVGENALVLHPSHSADYDAYRHGSDNAQPNSPVSTEATYRTASASFPVTSQQVTPCYGFNVLANQEVVSKYVVINPSHCHPLENSLAELRHLDRFVKHTPATSKASSRPIHVFIDLSNIIIGWTDMIKKLHGLNKNARIRAPSFDFGALDYILTRGREVNKRVLAGSVHWNAASVPEYMEHAEQMGYELCVFRRVVKTNGTRFGQAHKTDSHNTTSSGDDGLPGIATKFSEQGVDEILHLKMVQSALDCAKEPATAVVVTGDAAEAQFSDGFKANVERLLLAGWVVEIYAWSDNMSASWKEISFLKRWEKQIRLIRLDAFALDLIMPAA